MKRCERNIRKADWVMVQTRLKEIAKTLDLLQDADAEPDSTKEGRKPILRLFNFGQLKKPRVPASESPSALDLAGKLSQTIEWLSVHSETSFDFLWCAGRADGGSTEKHQQISHCVTVRHGAVGLYEACERSTRHCERSGRKCELELELFGDCIKPTDQQGVPPLASETNLFYHIVVRSANNLKAACGILLPKAWRAQRQLR